MATVLDGLSAALLIAGSLFAVIGGIGLIRLPDFYCRIHGGGVTDTLGAGLILLGLALQSGGSLATAKVLMILFFVLITSPTSAHALAKSALAAGLDPERPDPHGDGPIEQLNLTTLLVDFLLLGLLVCTAVTIVRLRSLLAAVLLTGIYSFLGAGWMLALDAPDVAFTEAAVGAGIATVLMLGTLALTSRSAKRETRSPLLPLAAVTLTGAALVYGTLDMPEFGDPSAPIHTYPSPSYIERTPKEIGVPNVVTAVLGSYRGYDTLGETVVIFTAGVGVLLLLRGSGRSEPEQGE